MPHKLVFTETTKAKYGILQIFRNITQRLWGKRVLNIMLFLCVMSFLLPLQVFYGADRIENFPGEVSIGDIIHIPTGKKVTFSDLGNFFDCADVLYVGEAHANKAAHDVQMKILKAFYERFGNNNIAVGMEMFTRPYQPFLDQWVAGEIDEDRFLEDTRWDELWGYDYNLYRDILEFVREKKIPVIALNAPRYLVQMVSKKGLDNLTEEERQELPEINVSDVFHRIYLEKSIGSHIDYTKGIERYNEVQSLWEEYMAQTIVNYMSSWEGRGRKLLVFVGNGHIVYDFGIPKRVFRRAPLPYFTIYPAEFHGNKPSLNHSLFFPEIPLEPADFVWVITPLQERKRIYLGVQISKTSDDELIVQEISPGSPAERAGIVAGDKILAIDGRNFKNVIDIVRYLQTKTFGDTCIVEIKRDGTTILYNVTLFEMEHY